MNTMTVGLIGRSRIRPQPNLPNGPRRIRSTNRHYRWILSLDLVQKLLADYAS